MVSNHEINYKTIFISLLVYKDDECASWDFLKAHAKFLTHISCQIEFRLIKNGL